MIELRQTKRGKWRAYELTKQAYDSWLGENFKVTVLHDLDGTIIEAPNPEALESFLVAQRWYQHTYNGERPLVARRIALP